MKHLIPRTLFIIACIFSVACRRNNTTDKIDEYLAGLINDHKISGAAVEVLKGNLEIFNKNYGFADLQNKIPVTDSTPFYVMSVTKIFIASAVMKLAINHRVDLKASIRSYLPDLPAAYDSVSPYQLLSHSAGVPDYVHVKGYMKQADRNQLPMEVLKPVMALPLNFSPGEKNEYSNSGYFLLGLLIEKVTGQNLQAYLKNNLFDPAGLDHTYLDDSIKPDKPGTKGYRAVNDTLREEKLLNSSQYWAAGGIVTTKADLIKWDKAFMNGRILPLKVVKLMMQPVELKNGKPGDYGLGFELMNDPGMKVAGNNGVGIGFNAANMDFLNDGLTIIVLTNTTNGNSTMIALNIRDRIIGGKKIPPEATPAVNDSLDTLVKNLFLEAGKGIPMESYFSDTSAFNKFVAGNLKYIQDQGNFKSLARMGEKKNPQTLVRRYRLKFKNSETDWIIIFSDQGKILVTNHR